MSPTTSSVFVPISFVAVHGITEEQIISAVDKILGSIPRPPRGLEVRPIVQARFLADHDEPHIGAQWVEAYRCWVNFIRASMGLGPAYVI